MAWTNISDTFLEPGKPVRSADLIALRDNPGAIASGAAGAPRIVNAGLADATLGAEKFQSGTDERDWVLVRTAGAGAGAVGTYAMAWAFGIQNFGTTVAGSSLYPSNADNSSFGSALPGSWRCMGVSPNTSGAGRVTAWLRIS